MTDQSIFTRSTRRNLIIGTASVAMAAATPATASAAPPGWRAVDTSVETPDAALIRLCAEHIANREAFNTCNEDSDDNPLWDAYMRTLRAIDASHPTTMAGFRAKAWAAKSEATMPNGRMLYEGTPAMGWMISLVDDLVGSAAA